MKGIKIFGNEIKLSQFADDTTLFNADLGSLEKTLKIVEDFGKLAGLYLNVKKTKAIWLCKWMNNENKPLNISWFHCPVKILGIHFSYDEKGNNDFNFSQKIRKLQTKLDMWSSRDLTIFGRVMILKILGLSQLVFFRLQPCSSSENGGFSENKIVKTSLKKQKNKKLSSSSQKK